MDVLFLGNSYSYYGIDPAHVPLANGFTSHNFAFAGEGIGDTYYKVEHYLNRGRLPKLKLVVINVDNYNFFGPAAPLNTAYPYARYYDFADIYRSNRGFLRSALLSTLSLYRVSLQTSTLIGNRLFVAPKEETIEGSGYSRRDYAISAASLNADTATYASLERVKVYETNPALYGYFRKLVSDLQRRHIEVVFIIVPTPAMFLTPLDRREPNATNRTESRDFLEGKTEAAVRSLFPTVPIHNYMRDSSGFSVGMFSDRGHLNYAGARVFSAMLARDINSYLESSRNQRGNRTNAAFN